MNKPWGITDSLRTDHDELRRLMAVLKDESSVEKKREIFAQEFLPFLESYTCAQEETLTSRSLTEERLRAFANDCMEEHDLIEFEAAKIRIAATDEQWMARLKLLTELLDRHLAKEEAEFFPVAEQVLSPEEQSELATRYSETRERHRLAPIIQLPIRTFATAEENTGT